MIPFVVFFIDINKFTNCKTFSEFKSARSANIFEVSFPRDEMNWMQAECICAPFFKLYICEHIISIALRKKLTRAPLEAKNIPLGAKRKRGRPCKAKQALVVQ